MNLEKTTPNSDKVRDFFSKAISSNKLCQSYLLVNSDIKYIYEISRELAAKLNCSYKDGSSCGKCFNCKSILEGNHPKTPIYIKGEGAKNIIKVELIRNLQSELMQSSDYYRVVVIEDASSKSLAKFAATALLKTIEEAKPNTLFLFAAQSKDDVLNTISSRCQVLQASHTNEQVLEASELSETYKIGELNRSRLEQLLVSEELAKYENNELLYLLQSWQKELSEEFSISNSKKIESLDKAISSLRNFVRPHSVFQNLLPDILEGSIK